MVIKKITSGEYSGYYAVPPARMKQLLESAAYWKNLYVTETAKKNEIRGD